MAPLHELDPSYVPVTDVDEIVAFPETFAEHVLYGLSNPPASTETVNCSDEPETVPETVPLPVSFVDVSVMDIVPEIDVPDCVTCHVIWPGPDESFADPDHVPVSDADVDGGELGSVGEPDEHARAEAISANATSLAAAFNCGNRTRNINYVSDRNTAGFALLPFLPFLPFLPLFFHCPAGQSQTWHPLSNTTRQRPSASRRQIELKIPVCLPFGSFTGPLLSPSVPDESTSTVSGSQENGACG